MSDQAARHRRRRSLGAALAPFLMLSAGCAADIIVTTKEPADGGSLAGGASPVSGRDASASGDAESAKVMDGGASDSGTTDL